MGPGGNRKLPVTADLYRSTLTVSGDILKRIILIIALISTAFCYSALTVTEVQGAEAEEDVLKVDNGDLNLTGLWSYGLYDFNLAEAVKLKPPTASWTLERVQIAGWGGYEGENDTFPDERIICIEIRDKDLNILGRYVDSQVPYFSDTLPILAIFEIPPIEISDEFYICFYDRGAVVVGFDQTELAENSFVYNRATKNMVPSSILVNDTADTVEEIPVNWCIRAVGH